MLRLDGMTDLLDEPLLAEDEDTERLDLENEVVLDPDSAEFVHDLVERVIKFTEVFTDSDFFPYQRELAYRIIESLVINDGEEITGLQSRQSGKALALDTPVLTPEGWSTMGALDVGDRVFSRDGTPTTIVATSPVFTDHDCYRVTFSDGQSIVADAGHRWSVRVGRDNHDTVLTTEAIAQDFRTKEGYEYHVGVASPVEMPEADLPLDPYLLGAWLGDGSSHSAEVTTADWEIAQEFADHYEIGYAKSKDHGKAITYSFLGGLYRELRLLGVIKVSRPSVGYTNRGKHIPERYLLASPKQRLALLQGLMDTDGHCTNHGEVEFCSTNLDLAEGVLFLARSLGWKATMREDRASLNGKDCGPKYRVCWTPYRGEQEPFRLQRKVERMRSRSEAAWRARRTYELAVVNVERIDTVPTKCISVDHPDHVFLAGEGLVPTHNSQVISQVIAGCMVLFPKLATIEPFKQYLGKFRKGLWVGVFAPVESQAETVFSRVVDWLTSDAATDILLDPEIDDQVEGGGKLIKLKKSGSFCRMQTANPRAKIESKSYHIVFIDEAQDADDFTITKSIMPMLAFYNGTVVMTGTPARTKGHFYRAIQRNKRRATRRGARQNHLQYDWRYCAKYNPNYARFIAKEKVRLGEDSDEFRLSYALHWLLDRGMLLTEERFEALGDVTMERVQSYWRTPVLVGVDPARTVDSTVVTVVWVDWDHPDDMGFYHHRVLNWLEITGDDWESQYFQIIDFLSNYNVWAVGVDGQGMGDVVADRLSVLMGPDVQVIPIPSTLPEQSKRWKHLTALMDRHMIGWPAHSKTRRLKVWKRFAQQMQDAEKSYKGPNMLVEAPDEQDAHDDYPDSLALACVLSADLQMPEVETTVNPFYT